MKLVSWNVNGLRACMNKGFEDFFKEVDADIFCVQETKMQPEQADFSFDGYLPYWNSAVKKGYSGTAVFTKKEPLSVSYDLGLDKHNDEGRVITLEYEDFYMKINTGMGIININGFNLELEQITEEDALVRGRIENIDIERLDE